MLYAHGAWQHWFLLLCCSPRFRAAELILETVPGIASLRRSHPRQRRSAMPRSSSGSASPLSSARVVHTWDPSGCCAAARRQWACPVPSHLQAGLQHEDECRVVLQQLLQPHRVLEQRRSRLRVRKGVVATAAAHCLRPCCCRRRLWERRATACGCPKLVITEILCAQSSSARSVSTECNVTEHPMIQIFRDMIRSSKQIQRGWIIIAIWLNYCSQAQCPGDDLSRSSRQI